LPGSLDFPWSEHTTPSRLHRSNSVNAEPLAFVLSLLNDNRPVDAMAKTFPATLCGQW
jgi:hypothetical protein